MACPFPLCKWTGYPGTNAVWLPPHLLLPHLLPCAAELLVTYRSRHFQLHPLCSVTYQWASCRKKKTWWPSSWQSLCTDPAILNVHLSRFVLETRKSNSVYYPPKTLYLILCGILQHMRSINRVNASHVRKITLTHHLGIVISLLVNSNKLLLVFSQAHMFRQDIILNLVL